METIKKGDCLIVVGRVVQPDGYTRQRINGVRDQSHRHVYRQYNGEIPDGMVVRHTCDNPGCVNPDHLILGTIQDNVNDRVNRERGAVGVNNGRNVLEESQVLEIRSITNRTNYSIAKEYGVNPSTIRDIRNGKIWKRLPSTL